MKIFNKSSKKISLCIMLLICIFSANIMGCSLFKGEDQKKAAEKKFKEIALKELNGESVSETKFSKDTYGDNAQVLEVFAKAFNEMLNNENDFEDKVDNYKFDSYVNKETLSNKDKINKAIKETEDVKSAVGNYKLQYEKSVNNIKTSINKLKISDSYKKSFLKGFDEGVNSSKERNEEDFNVETQLFNKAISYLQFFYGLNGKFDYKDNMFYFYKQSELDNFNTLTGQIQDLLKQEEDLANQYNEDKNEFINKLKK